MKKLYDKNGKEIKHNSKVIVPKGLNTPKFKATVTLLFDNGKVHVEDKNWYVWEVEANSLKVVIN